MSKGHTSIILFYFCNFVLGFGTRKCETFRLFGVHWQSLWISGWIDFYFCNNKNATRIFIRVIPNLQITYSVDIILPLPVWRTWSIIPLVCNFSFISLNDVLSCFPFLVCFVTSFTTHWPELAVCHKLAWNSQPFCFSLLNAGTTGVCYQVQHQFIVFIVNPIIKASHLWLRWMD